MIDPIEALGPATVLIVDDDAASAAEVAEALRALGHEPMFANGWMEAVRAFDERVDLVLMDAVMPEVDGFKLTRMLRDSARSYTPILFLTALGDAAAKEQGMLAGADDFLTKPPDPVELRVRLTAMLRIRRLTQYLESERSSYERLAHVDELTGLPNRRRYDERMHSELALARRSGRPVTLLLVDIDHFKDVNDSLGHQVGDEVLGFMGELLDASTRRGDWPFRFGGEEFAIIARNTTAKQASVLGERIRGAFEARSRETAAGLRTCSVGIASFEPADTPEALFARADARLYAAKQAGRNRVIWED